MQDLVRDIHVADDDGHMLEPLVVAVRRDRDRPADRARQLGWTGVEIVDDDLGRSGGGVARPGFDRLIGAICAGDVGAVLAIEASRLARNGRDWLC